MKRLLLGFLLALGLIGGAAGDLFVNQLGGFGQDTGIVVPNDNSLDLEQGSSQRGSVPSWMTTGASSGVCWVKPETLTNAGEGIFVAGTTGLIVQNAGAGNVGFARVGTSAINTNGTVLVNGTWAFIGWSHAGGNITTANSQVFLNGVEQAATQSGTASESYSGTVYVGFQTDSATYFDGIVDECAIWNVALTATEHQQLYERSITAANLVPDYRLARRGDNLQAYWRFEQSSGTTVKDVSGNGRTLTLDNAPSFSTDVP